MSVRYSFGVYTLQLLTSTLLATPALAQSWQANVDYGANTQMDMYVPASPATPAPVVVSLHYCGGTKGNAQPWFKSYADTHGFIIITPQAGGNCFDAAPTRGGERANIVSMVEYVVEQHDGDPTRVFAAGPSSGACMAHALLAAYPEVFTGGSSLAGVPAGAWTGGNEYGWSSPQRSAQEWGDIMREGSEGYMGQWPRMQIWHAQGDEILFYADNYEAQVAQWTNVHGVSEGMNELIQPQGATDTWDRTSYYNADGQLVVEANSVGSQVPHDLSGRGLWGDIVRFFALDQPPGEEPVRGAPVDGSGTTDDVATDDGTDVMDDSSTTDDGTEIADDTVDDGGDMMDDDAAAMDGDSAGSDDGSAEPAGDPGAGGTPTTDDDAAPDATDPTPETEAPGGEMMVTPPTAPAVDDQPMMQPTMPAMPGASTPVDEGTALPGDVAPAPSAGNGMLPAMDATAASSSGSEGGCSISAREGSQRRGLSLLVLGALGAALARRRGS